MQLQSDVIYEELDKEVTGYDNPCAFQEGAPEIVSNSKDQDSNPATIFSKKDCIKNCNSKDQDYNLSACPAYAATTFSKNHDYNLSPCPAYAATTFSNEDCDENYVSVL